MATDRIFDALSSLAIKAPVLAATTANITLSGLQSVDGVSLAQDDRVLVKNQTTGSENGIYVADTGTWARGPDFDGSRDVTEGSLFPVNQGTANSNTLWRLDTTGTITIGTTSLSLSETIFSDSNVLTFLQAGVGAVSRTAQNKMRDIISVKDFGATGDGSTDDTTFIQAAFDALGTNGGEIYFPAGKYKITSSLTYTGNNLGILGEGKPSYPGSTTVPVTITTTAAIVMLKIGSAASTTHNGPRIDGIMFEDAGGTVTQAIQLLRTNNGRIYDCSFRDITTGVAIELDGTGDAVVLTEIHGCYIRNCKFGLKEIGTVAATYVFGGFWNGSNIAGGIGIQVTSGGDKLFTNLDNWVTAILINGDQNQITCRIESCTTGIQIQTGQRNMITSNSITSTTTPVQIDATVGVSNMIVFNAYSSSLTTVITDNSDLADQTIIFEPTVNRMRLNYGVAGETYTYDIHNRRSALGEHAKYRAIAGGNDIIGKLEAVFDATPFTRIGSESNHDTAIIANDVIVARAYAAATGGFQVIGGQFNSGPFRLGSHYLWVDATGDLRIKSSAPASDLDGVVVGSQS